MKEEAPSPKETSTNSILGSGFIDLWLDALQKIDWSNPPKREPIKPLFPPKEKK